MVESRYIIRNVASVITRYGERREEWPWVERVTEDGVAIARPRGYVGYRNNSILEKVDG